MRLTLKEMILLSEIIEDNLRAVDEVLETCREEERIKQGTDWIKKTDHMEYLRARRNALQDILDELNDKHDI